MARRFSPTPLYISAFEIEKRSGLRGFKSYIAEKRILHGHAFHPPAPLFTHVYGADRASVLIASCDHTGAGCSDRHSA